MTFGPWRLRNNDSVLVAGGGGRCVRDEIVHSGERAVSKKTAPPKNSKPASEAPKKAAGVRVKPSTKPSSSGKGVVSKSSASKAAPVSKGSAKTPTVEKESKSVTKVSAGATKPSKSAAPSAKPEKSEKPEVKVAKGEVKVTKGEVKVTKPAAPTTKSGSAKVPGKSGQSASDGKKGEGKGAGAKGEGASTKPRYGIMTSDSVAAAKAAAAKLAAAAGLHPVKSTSNGESVHRTYTKLTKSPFSKKELEEFREMLLVKRRQIEGDVNSMESEALGGSSGSLSHLPQHMADQGTDTFDQSLALDLAASQRGLLREIDAALKRIEEGTYGICDELGKPIAVERLRHTPWARYCIEAARAHERSGWSR